MGSECKRIAQFRAVAERDTKIRLERGYRSLACQEKQFEVHLEALGSLKI